MRRAVLAMLAAATAASVALPGAAAAAPDPTGFTCGLSGLTSAERSQVDAAFVLTDDTNPLVLHSGSVTCEVWFDGDLHEVTGPVVATGVAVASGTVPNPPADTDVYVCTRFDLVNGRTGFWDGDAGAWSDDRWCSLAISSETRASS